MSAITIDSKIKMLPPHKQQEVSDFVDFLLSSFGMIKSSGDTSARLRPYAGCMSGTFGKMSDDFNEPLNEFKDYM